MIYGSEAYKINMERASRLEDPFRTITVLMDDRPGFSPDAAQDLICAMMEMGYLVREVTAQEFKQGISGFMVVLPHAQSVPAECAEMLESYWKQGGRVLILGGRLFGHLVVPGENGYEYAPLKKGEIRSDAIDAATSGKMYPIVMEGFAHTAKVYKVHNISSFMTEPQSIIQGNICADNESLVCPQPRHHGQGYDMGHSNRFIPMVQAMGEGGRANGLRGAAIFAMLSDVSHRVHHFVDDCRLGYVKGTNRGACAVGIGFKRQDILNIPGMREILEQLLKSMQRGIYLFEAGASTHVASAHEKIKLGAKVMNLTMDYREIQVEFTLKKGGKVLHRQIVEDLAQAADFTDFSIEIETGDFGEYTAETRLLYKKEVIDQIFHVFTVAQPYVGKPDEFVRVVNGEFMLGDQQWRAFGIDYWPLYSAGLEWNEYWYGWLDRRTYDPIEVERDLMLLEEMGLNCLFTRLDGNPIGHCADTMRDFALRCRHHGMKLMVSFCNATGPFNFQVNAFERYLKDSWLLDDPVLFAHDIGWEVGAKFFNRTYMNIRDGVWEKWIVERYGSIENAETDWGIPVDRTEMGRITAPPNTEFAKEGPWRIKVCAYRRFLIEYISKAWNICLGQLRKVDNKHLYTCRTGAIRGDLTMAMNAGVKHMDFTSPEGWRMPNEDEGIAHAYSIPLAMKMYAGGKPTVWAEYGYSSCEQGWRDFAWDYEKLGPFDWAEEDKQAWFHRFFSSHKDADINGTAPWWFPGGVRYSELSCCGACAQDGQLYPWAKEYQEMGKWFKLPVPKKEPDDYVIFDDEQYCSFWAHFLWGDESEDEKYPRDFNYNRLAGKVRGEASLAIEKAHRNGKKIAFRTPGSGTTSATMPMVAVGNVPLNGNNPPRYLDAEFNYLETKDGEIFKMRSGIHIKPSDIRLSVGNIQFAAWLKPEGDSFGGVYLTAIGKEKVSVPITADTPYLTDAVTEWMSLTEHGEYTLQMEATGIGFFGEKWHITVE